MTILATIMAFTCVAFADNDRAVSFDRLPEKARDFISVNFPGEKLAYAKQERDFLEVNYEVVMVSGPSICFMTSWLSSVRVQTFILVVSR